MLIFKKVPVTLLCLVGRSGGGLGQPNKACTAATCCMVTKFAMTTVAPDYFNNWQVVFLGSPVCRGIADNLKGAVGTSEHRASIWVNKTEA